MELYILHSNEDENLAVLLTKMAHDLTTLTVCRQPDRSSHHWNLGHRCAVEIARRTKIPVRTVGLWLRSKSEIPWSIGVIMTAMTLVCEGCPKIKFTRAD